MRVGVGVDLTASQSRPTSICAVIEGVLSFCDRKSSDYEITSLVSGFRGRVVVAIDAPLSIVNKGFRPVERLLIKNRFRLLPLGLTGMKKLAVRGVRLRESLEKKGIVVIETHPSSALKSAGCSREDVIKCLRKFVVVPDDSIFKSKDDIDAAIAATVAWSYIIGYIKFYSTEGDTIYLLPEIATKI
jgi:predicted nuclease with RNAse H fold